MLSRLLPSRRRVRRSPADPWALSAKLLEWSADQPWSVGDSVENCLILGGTGSGKTSASGRTLALAMLKSAYGGLVLCSKASEVELWKSYARESNRLDDLIVVTPDSARWRFNPLDFEVRRKGGGAGLTENIASLFFTILELAERRSGNSGGGEDGQYWSRATRQLVRNFVNLLVLATGRVSVGDLYRAIISAPQSLDDVRSEAWRTSSHCYMLLREAERKNKTLSEQRDLELVADYVLLEFPALAAKTRSIIVSSFTSQVDVMQRSVLRNLFGADTTFTPDASEHGRIIVVGLPVKEFGEVGLIANVLMKYCWMRSIERRDVEESPRPVFLWGDEFQNFVTSYDTQYLATCRSAKAATVILSQNLPGLYSALGGGDKARVEIDSLLGSCGTRLFHANLCATTNDWAANLCGRSRQLFLNAGRSHAAEGGLAGAMGLAPPGQANAGMSEQLDFEIPPSAFTKLRTGGEANLRYVDAILVRSGRVFQETGGIWRPVTFRQKQR